MNAIKLCAAVAVVAVVGAACQRAADEAADDASPNNAVTAGDNSDASRPPGAGEPDTAGTPERGERPQPDAPRAEGDALAELLASDDYLLLDVRRPDELEELGTVEGYLNIPIEELADRLDEVPRDRPILTA